MEMSGLEYIALWGNLTLSFCALEQDVIVNVIVNPHVHVLIIRILGKEFNLISDVSWTVHGIVFKAYSLNNYTSSKL